MSDAALAARLKKRMRSVLEGCDAWQQLPLPSAETAAHVAMHSLIDCAVDAFFEQVPPASVYRMQLTQVPLRYRRPRYTACNCTQLRRSSSLHAHPPALDGLAGLYPRWALSPHIWNHMQLSRACIPSLMWQDLLKASLQLMRGAHGSFGLVLSHSLDVQNEVVIAARGQTMSVAFYPAEAAVLFGSEAAATKVGMGALASEGSFRVDLDDVTGEVMLLRWREAPAEASRTSSHCGYSGGRRSMDSLLEAERSTTLSSGGRACPATEVFRFGSGEGACVLVAATFLEDGSYAALLPPPCHPHLPMPPH